MLASIGNLAVRSQFKIMASRMLMLVNGTNHQHLAQHRNYYSGYQRSCEIIDYNEQIKNALNLNHHAQKQTVRLHEDILVKVLASSINSIDIELAKGIAKQQQLQDNIHVRLKNFPLTTGRDFVGEIVDVGIHVRSFRPGDIVWGTLAPYEDGSHGDFVRADVKQISPKPFNLNYHEAAALPYVGLTAYNAMGNFCGSFSYYNKNVLVLGGSGNVGSFAIQLLNYWGANVYATSSPKHIQSLKDLTDLKECVDYNETEDFLNNLDVKFHMIFDAGSQKAARKNFEMLAALIVKQKEKCIWDEKLTKYICLKSPDTKQYDYYATEENGQCTFGKTFDYANYYKNQDALVYLKKLIENGIIKPFQSFVYDFEDILDAYEIADKRQLPFLSKIVINHNH